jgi:EAL domain-containing protein (putative c-di-GMP-specific phosphodiesterase class I)
MSVVPAAGSPHDHSRFGHLANRLLKAVRMTDDASRIVTPDKLLPIAERVGLIHAIDRWVVKHAIHLIAAERQAGRELRLEVNLRGHAFTDHELLPLIEDELMRTRIDPALLLETTETAAIADMAQAQSFIHTPRQWGCRFAIDDVGVGGFSSFTYLKHLSVAYVKRDGSFIRNLRVRGR